MTMGKSNTTTKTFQVVKPFLRKKFPVTLQREEVARLSTIYGVVDVHVRQINYDFQPAEDQIRYVEMKKGFVNIVKRILKERKYVVLDTAFTLDWRTGDSIVACIPKILYVKDLRVWQCLEENWS